MDEFLHEVVQEAGAVSLAEAVSCRQVEVRTAKGIKDALTLDEMVRGHLCVVINTPAGITPYISPVCRHQLAFTPLPAVDSSRTYLKLKSTDSWLSFAFWKKRATFISPALYLSTLTRQEAKLMLAIRQTTVRRSFIFFLRLHNKHLRSAGKKIIPHTSQPRPLLVLYGAVLAGATRVYRCDTGHGDFVF